MHSKGITHGDLKETNILYDGSKVTLIDFGLCQFDQVFHVSGGTDDYMAPECLHNRQCTNKIDSYSLGVVFLNLVTHLFILMVIRCWDFIAAKIR